MIMQSTTSYSSFNRFLICVVVMLMVALPLSILKQTVRAATVDDLTKQKQLLQQKAQQAEQQAQQQKTVAQRAQDKIEEVNTQISSISDSLATTQSNIADTQTKLEQQKQQAAALESELSQVQRQQDAVIREMYISRVSYPSDLMLFSEDDLGKQERIQSHFDALKKALESMYDKTNQAKQAVLAAQADLQRQQDQLVGLQNQQEEQKSALADFRLTQAELRDNAQQTVLNLEAKAKDARVQMAKIEDQISVALAAAISARAKGITGTGPGVGGRVHRGDFVGNEGSTGFSTGPHVHFEVRANGVPVNPAPYVSSGVLSWPVTSFTITQNFGHTDYSYVYAGGIHTGIDCAGPYGQPVYAPADGTVILHQWYGGYGHAWAEQLDNGLVVLLGHMI